MIFILENNIVSIVLIWSILIFLDDGVCIGISKSNENKFSIPELCCAIGSLGWIIESSSISLSKITNSEQLLYRIKFVSVVILIFWCKALIINYKTEMYFIIQIP